MLSSKSSEAVKFFRPYNFHLISLSSQAYCGGSSGRAEQSLGRRRREVDDATDLLNETDDRSLALSEQGSAGDEDALEERVKRMIEVGRTFSGLSKFKMLLDFEELFSIFGIPRESVEESLEPLLEGISPHRENCTNYFARDRYSNLETI